MTLGGYPELVYFAGGATGALLGDSIDQLPIKQHKIEASGPTRISYTVHETQLGLEYRFVPEGPKIEEKELAAFIRQIEKLEFDYIVATGSLPKNVPDDIYKSIANIAIGKGARMILDSSGPALKSALDGSGVFLVKPSLAELEQLVGQSLDREQAGAEAIRLVRAGQAQNVAVSMDKDGALLANGNGLVHVAAPQVTVRSSVGAGDSFVGAMTFALASGIAVEEAFHFAVSAGSAAVMTPGSELCRKEDVEKLYRLEREKRGKNDDENLQNMLFRQSNRADVL